MSKIKKPIDIQGMEVSVSGQQVNFKGKKGSGVFVVPQDFEVTLSDTKLFLKPRVQTGSRDLKMMWGMNRALLENKIVGTQTPFEKKLQINGLGFKALAAGKKLEFSLGYSHKMHYELPQEVTVEIDKTGQLLTFRSIDKEMLGAVCDRIRSFRPPEPYKGTGIKLTTETIIRKAGKAKSTAG